MEILLDDDQREALFLAFIAEESDLSYDWFTDYFQQEHGDRDKFKQDFTPRAVCDLVNGLTGKADRVADICAGTGGLTIKKWLENGPGAFYYCEEFSSRAIPILLFNLAIRGMRAEVVHCDALSRETFGVYHLQPAGRFSRIQAIETGSFEADGASVGGSFDQVIMNPPYSLAWSGDKALAYDERFIDYGLPPKSKADYAFVLYGLSLLKKGGRLVAVLPHGVLFRGQAEGLIRQRLLEKGELAGIIGLPDKLFLNTGIPVCLLVLEKGRAETSVFFVDASRDFLKGRNRNELTDQQVATILSAYGMRRTIDRYAYLADLGEIKANGFNLNIPRYVDTYIPEPLVPVSELARDILEIHQDILVLERSLLETMRGMVGDSVAEQELIAEEVAILETFMGQEQLELDLWS